MVTSLLASEKEIIYLAIQSIQSVGILMNLKIRVFLNLIRKVASATRRGMPQLGSLLRMNTIIKNHETLSIGLKPIAKSETEQYLFWRLEGFKQVS